MIANDSAPPTSLWMRAESGAHACLAEGGPSVTTTHQGRRGRALRRLTGALLMLSLCGLCQADDVVNGWSGDSTILHLYSDGSATFVRLNNVSSGCGHAYMWRLPVSDQPSSKAKLAILLSAYAAGRVLNLRCEASMLTDIAAY